MRKIFAGIALALSLGLGACTWPTLNIASQVNLNTEAGILSGYGLVLNAENALKTLPLCKTGSAPSVTNICVKRSVIVNLQAADRKVNADVNAMVAFVKKYPSVSPAQYIAAAQDALLSAQTIINSNANGS